MNPFLALIIPMAAIPFIWIGISKYFTWKDRKVINRKIVRIK